ncbi:FHA domain-containing protein [Planctomycetales bacterium ZRK34]|nr:FHA domain-containing protein [Planctomycetales bacterium ZRK34]
MQDQAYLIIPKRYGHPAVSLSRREAWTLGRSRSCHVVLDHPKVSRTHASIQHVPPGRFVLTDLDSRNGCFVNDQRITAPTALNNGDRVKISSEIELRFLFPTQSQSCDLPPQEAESSPDLAAGAREKRHISVLVIDIRNYTTLTRLAPLERLADAMGQWYAGVTTILTETSGSFEKFIGDAVLSVWIHDDASDAAALEPVRRSVHALRQIRFLTLQVNARFELPQPLQISAGINTGPAIVRRSPTVDHDIAVLGDTVNRAFRFESATRDLEVDLVLGPAVYTLLAPRIPLPEKRVQLKGYDAPVPVHTAGFDDLAALLTTEERTLPG